MAAVTTTVVPSCLWLLGGSLLQTVSSLLGRFWNGLLSWVLPVLLYHVPLFRRRQDGHTGATRRQNGPRTTPTTVVGGVRGVTTIGELAAASYQRAGGTHYPLEDQEFKISITGRNSIAIELLDGGLCLESEDDDEDEFTMDGQSSLGMMQQAIQAILQQQSEEPITKLDLFASHFRATFTVKMMGNLLQAFHHNNLEHLQLGGMLLSVRELCNILSHPSLCHQLKHLTLYDLELTSSGNYDDDGEEMSIYQPSSLTTTTTPLLALEEVVAVFLRLQDPTVTLDPLFRLLRQAPRLRLLELVLDHNHAYVHGYPRITTTTTNVLANNIPNSTTPLPTQTQPAIFSPKSLAELLQATSAHLKTIILEYVPLAAPHFLAISRYALALKHLRLRDDPEIVRRIQQQPDENEEQDRITALASLLQAQEQQQQKEENSSASSSSSAALLESVSLDGILTSPQDMTTICSALNNGKTSTIHSLRLRSLPMSLQDLTLLLAGNATLQYLSLHNLDFYNNKSDSKCTPTPVWVADPTVDGDRSTFENNLQRVDEAVAPNDANNDHAPELLEEDAVLARVVQILKDDNVTLRRLSYKFAEFRRTEIFPRRRKPKAHHPKCYPARQQQQQRQQWPSSPRRSELSQQQQQQSQPDDNSSSLCPQQQLHWFLTLNQRGIRNLMVDVNRTRAELVQLMTDQEKHHHLQLQQLFLDYPAPPSLPPAGQDTSAISSNSSNSDECWALDCVFHMLSCNPTLCS